MIGIDDLGFAPDKIGEWSERKIRIVSKYATAYARVLSAQPRLRHYYIDGFTGGGVAVRRDTGEPVETTARRILSIEPPFVGYHLVDADPAKAEAMRLACQHRPQATAYCGDANKILPEIFKTIRYDDYQRALCFLDPYKILLAWDVVKGAAANQALEAFIHFPTGDIARNVLHHNADGVAQAQIDRMNHMWGDDSWRQSAYATQRTLFGSEEVRQSTSVLIAAFVARLKDAGFTHVSRPQPMRISTGTTLYHLIFATHNATAARIASDILTREQAPR